MRAGKAHPPATHFFPSLKNILVYQCQKRFQGWSLRSCFSASWLEEGKDRVNGVLSFLTASDRDFSLTNVA